MSPRKHWKLLAAATAIALAVPGLGSTAVAADEPAAPAPILHYDFRTAPQDGVTIPNLAGGSDAATLTGTGAVFGASGVTLPGGSATSGAAYVTIPSTSLAGKNDLSISVWLRNATGKGNYAAAYIGNTATKNGYWLFNPSNPSGYVKSVVTTATAASPNSSPWSTEQGAASTGAPTGSSTAATGEMALYTTVIDGTNGTITLYVNGVQISTTATTGSIAKYGDASSLVAYIGKSSYSDIYFSGTVGDYAAYASALTSGDVASLYREQLVDVVSGAITVPATAAESFQLPVSYAGAAISWSSDDPAIAVASSGAATVVRPDAGAQDAAVTLTATITKGTLSAVKTYSVTVPRLLSDAERVSTDLDAITIHDASSMRTNFSVPTEGGNGSAIVWSIADAGTASPQIGSGVTQSTKTVRIQRPSAGSADTEIVLRATATSGSVTDARTFPVTVPAMPSDQTAKEAYVWAFFTGEGDGAEQVSLAASKGNDALSWNTLNDGAPLFTSDEGTKGLRDPFILRSHDGDKFYMLATDLKVAGLAGGFDTAQKTGSRAIEIYESTDLVHWSAQRHVEVSTALAGNTWAPEAYWDDARGTYVVYWASNLYSSADASARTAVTYNEMMFVTTDDFVTFSEPQKWIDVKRGTGKGTIDATVAEQNGVYYRFYKDEASMTIREEKSTDLLATVSGSLPTASAADGQWSLIKEKVASGLSNGESGGTFGSGEGPSIFPANPGDVNGYAWYLFIDQPSYHGGPDHYIGFATQDIADPNGIVSVASTLTAGLPQNADGGKPRHGTVIPVTRAEYQTVLEAYAPGIAVTSVDAISATTAPGVSPVLPATATLHTKAGGTETATVTWETLDPSAYARIGDTVSVSGVADDDTRQPVEATVRVTGTSSNATLSSLTVGGQAVDLAANSPVVLVSDPAALAAQDVVATTADAEASVQVTVGASAVTVVVTAPDQSTIRSYVVRLGSLTPSAHYTMAHSGTRLIDSSGNGRDATLVGLGDSSFSSIGGDEALNFAADGYVTLPKGLVTAGDNDFTVEMTVKTKTSANQFGWVIGDGIGSYNTTALGNYVFVNPSSSESAYSAQILSGIRVKTGSGNGEVRLPAGGGLNEGFTTVTLVSKGGTLTLYRDGAVISTVSHSYGLSSVIPGGDVLGYIGRSLYASDALFTGVVSDFAVWDEALSAGQVVSTAPSAAERAALNWNSIQTALVATMLGDNATTSAVTRALSFPATVGGIAVNWSSSEPDVVSQSGAVTRTTTERTTQITVSDTHGNSRVIGVTVPAQTTAELESMAQADLDAVVLKSRTTENLPLASTGVVNGSRIVWESSDPALVTGTDAAYAAPTVGAADPYAGAGVVERPAYGDGDRQATLTATATLGGVTAHRTVTVTVAERARTAPDAGYAAVNFLSDSATTGGKVGEALYESATSGNDFFTFSAVNGGNAVLTSTTDTKGLRDPYVLKSHFGDKYYMIATDLKISATNWTASQQTGSLKIEVWESTDMVHWSRTNTGSDAGITVNAPTAGMTWAPEAYWDDSLQAYVVFFSSRSFTGATTHTDATAVKGANGQAYNQLFSVITRDFQSFTYPPQTWQDTKYSRIDSTVIKIGEYYYRFTKNEESNSAGGLLTAKTTFMERSKVLTSSTTQTSWENDPETTWQLVDDDVMPFEGPEVIKLNQGDPNNGTGDGYVMMTDSGGYQPFVTTGAAIASSAKGSTLSSTKDWNTVKDSGSGRRSTAGMPEFTRHGAFVSVPKAVLDAMHAWTGIDAVGSATELSLDGRTAVARVTAADGGDVAGEVTFSAPGWSGSAKLTDGTAELVVPASVGGSVSAHYDGYSDGLVEQSTSDGTALAAIQPLSDRIAAVTAELGTLSASDFTLTSWTTLQSALAEARRVAADLGASQDEVDAALAALVSARAGLTAAGPAPSAKASSRVSIASSARTARLGANGTAVLRLTAAVTGEDGSPITGGDVVFVIAGRTVTVPVSAAVATATVRVSTSGRLTWHAVYLGSSAVEGSTSVPAVVTVAKARSATTVTTTPARPKIGSSGSATVQVRVRVTVAGTRGAQSGSVRLTIAGKTKTAAVRKGLATVRVTLRKAKSYAVTAKYTGTSVVASSSRTTKVVVKRR